MKNTLFKIAGGAALSFALLSISNATPLLINPTHVVPIIPANETNIYNGLTAAITAYNLANDPDLPGAGAIDLTPQVLAGFSGSVGGHVDAPANTLSLSFNFAVEQETYLALTWDGPNGGTQFFYVGGETGWDTFVAPFFKDKQYGLSHYIFTGPKTPSVPDGGTTALMLGLGLVALARVGYRRQAVKA